MTDDDVIEAVLAHARDRGETDPPTIARQLALELAKVFAEQHERLCEDCQLRKLDDQ